MDKPAETQCPLHDLLKRRWSPRAFSEQPVGYNAVTPEQYRGFGFPGADDPGNMFQFKHDVNEAFCGPRNPSIARSLNPALLTCEAWLA